MITSVSAKPRVGKTSFVVAQLVDKLEGVDDEDYINAVSYINSLRRKGVDAKLPKEHHTIHANIEFKSQYPNQKAYEVSGYDLGIPNKYHKVIRMMPYGIYILDECQKYYMADDKSRLPFWVRRMFELHGQYFMQFYLISQRYIWVHKDVRALINKFVYITESKHKYRNAKGKVYYSKKFLDGEEILQTTWYYKEFDDEADLEVYLKAQAKERKNIGRNCKYKFKGDIRDYYDPYNFKGIFEKCDEDFRDDDNSNDGFDRPDTWNTKEVKKSDVQKKAS